MEPDFWHQKWQRSDIGFHREEANPLLVEHFNTLALKAGGRVFVPLCGKTRDIAWLMAQGYNVAGVELSALAVAQLFEDLGVEPETVASGPLAHYRIPGLDVFVGDLFALVPEQLGPVAATYDRAALVALPDTLRARYVAHVSRLTQFAPQLLVTYEYDQAAIEGPPFSVNEEEVHELYGPRYRPTHLHTQDVPDGMKGKCPAKEHVWLLKQS